MDGKCPYCKAVWFEPGMTIGGRGFISEARFDRHQEMIDATRGMDGTLHMILGLVDNTVSLTMVGLSDKDVAELHESIQNAFRR